MAALLVGQGGDAAEEVEDRPGQAQRLQLLGPILEKTEVHGGFLSAVARSIRAARSVRRSLVERRSSYREGGLASYASSFPGGLSALGRAGSVKRPELEHLQSLTLPTRPQVPRVPHFTPAPFVRFARLQRPYRGRRGSSRASGQNRFKGRRPDAGQRDTATSAARCALTSRSGDMEQCPTMRNLAWCSAWPWCS